MLANIQSAKISERSTKEDQGAEKVVFIFKGDKRKG